MSPVLQMLVIIAAKYLIYASVALLLGYVLWKRRSARVGCLVAAGLALTYGFGAFLGSIFYNARPFVVGHFAPLLPHAANNGFPSDHMLLAAALAQIGLYFDRRLGAVLWIFAIVVGAARVLAGVHHPVDIVASASIAIIAVWLAQKLFTRSNIAR